MNYDIIPVEKFKKEAKRLAKKYPSLKKELLEINAVLSLNPTVEHHLVKAPIKLELQLKVKVREKVVELESLPTL